jgi:methionine aminotransferase
VLALREAIARKVAAHYGASCDPIEEITVTPGATQAIFCAVQSVVKAGDEVIVFDPAYDSYEPAVTLAGGITRHVPLQAPEFSIDWNRVDAVLGPKTRLVIINSPHNPTGALINAADLEQLADRLRDLHCFVLSDEVYEHIVFDGARHTSVLANQELAERSFVVSSFGKTYHATGWKVGYCIAPVALTRELRRVHQFVSFATVTPMQHALADYMSEKPDHEHELSAFYQSKRDRFCELFASTRFELTPARGTYFQLADYSGISNLDDVAFATWLTKEHGVATIPISVFCANAPPFNFVRFCFAKGESTLEAAAGRLAGL